MTAYCVEVYVKKGCDKDFASACEINHLNTIKEPGCLRFDVLKSADTEGLYFLYEVYSDETAVDAHKQTDHYMTWRETVEPWMEKKRFGRMFTPLNFT